MDSLIDLAQSAYIKGRSIFDNIFCAYKILYYTRHSSLEGILYKLDFSKAFDKLDLNYLIRLLKHRGFPTKWLLWMENIFLSSKVAVCINGEVGY